MTERQLLVVSVAVSWFLLFALYCARVDLVRAEANKQITFRLELGRIENKGEGQ
jgi:hypothetical protein